MKNNGTSSLLPFLSRVPCLTVENKIFFLAVKSSRENLGKAYFVQLLLRRHAVKCVSVLQVYFSSQPVGG